MSSVSLCMIVKNERDTLARCLNSVCAAVDEIIIVDTGSVDNTKAIASKFTENIFDFAWVDDFSAARNFSFSKATCDYILWLDADDVLPAGEAQKLTELSLSLKNIPDVVMMKYQTAFDENDCVMWCYRERLLKRSRGFQWHGAVHEVITPEGQILYSDVTVQHRRTPRPPSDRNLHIYQAILEKGCELSARDNYYYARELFEWGRFDESAEILETFLDRIDGWSEDKLSACLMLSDCYAKKGDRKRQLSSLYRSLAYDEPRAGLCCALGKWYLGEGYTKAAAFWFRSALACPPPQSGFVWEEDREFLPCIWLCVCYDRLGDLNLAQFYNERARAVKPSDPSVLHNQAYLKTRLAEMQSAT